MKKRTFEEKQYDLVIFGATGFTGKLAAEYLAKQYGTSISWAIAGRNSSKLQRVKSDLVQINPDVKDLDIIMSDSKNMDHLIAMANNTRVVISTVGPFDRYGSQLVATCAFFGTNYCDITGEIHWLR